MAMKKCGKCAGCKKGGMCTMKWTDSKADKAADKKTMKGMTPAQKAAFEKGDKKMDAKKPSKAADMKMDKALAAKVKKTVPAKKKK
jgi:hypothetical protein